MNEKNWAPDSDDNIMEGGVTIRRRKKVKAQVNLFGLYFIFTDNLNVTLLGPLIIMTSQSL